MTIALRAPACSVVNASARTRRSDPCVSLGLGELHRGQPARQDGVRIDTERLAIERSGRPDHVSPDGRYRVSVEPHRLRITGPENTAASLEFLEGKALPGVTALTDK